MVLTSSESLEDYAGNNRNSANLLDAPNNRLAHIFASHISIAFAGAVNVVGLLMGEAALVPISWSAQWPWQ